MSPSASTTSWKSKLTKCSTNWAWASPPPSMCSWSRPCAKGPCPSKWPCTPAAAPPMTTPPRTCPPSSSATPMTSAVATPPRGGAPSDSRCARYSSGRFGCGHLRRSRTRWNRGSRRIPRGRSVRCPCRCESCGCA